MNGSRNLREAANPMYGLPAPASSSMTDDVIRWQFVAGIYPMLLDETCFSLAVDFEVHPIGTGDNKLARSSNQRPDLRADIGQLVRRHFALTFRFSDAPIHAFDLIGEYDAGNRRRDGYFKGIALHLRRHGTAEHEACLAVIGDRTQDESGPVTGLLSSCVRTEV